MSSRGAGGGASQAELAERYAELAERDEDVRSMGASVPSGGHEEAR